MKAFHALAQGFTSSIRAYKIIIWLYAINFAVALLITTAFRSALVHAAGNSLALNALIKEFDYTTYSDFMNAYGDSIKPIFAQFMWGALLMLTLNTLFGGGIICSLAAAGKKTFKEFLSDSGEYFWRFFKLLLIALVPLSLVVGISFMILGFVFASVDADAVSEKPVVITTILTLILLQFPAIFVLMITDYARVITVQTGERKAFRAYWSGVKKVFRYFFSVWTIQIAMIVSVAAATLIYWWLDSVIGMTSGGTIVFMFLIQQLFIVSRVWMRLWSQGSALAFVTLTPERKEEIKNVPVVSQPSAIERGIPEQPVIQEPEIPEQAAALPKRTLAKTPVRKIVRRTVARRRSIPGSRRRRPLRKK